MTAADDPGVVGAIGFCFQHDLQWQDDCAECQAARPVRDMVAAHVALFPACDSWPLCGCGSEAD